MAQAGIAERRRILFESRELDRLFGGGIVPGSVTLVGGPPGVGKSTLLLQMAALLCRGVRGDRPYREFFARHGAGGSPEEGSRDGGITDSSAASEPLESRALAHVAYVSGEESASQLHARASRLGVDAPGLLVLNETRVEDILAQLDVVAGALHRAASGRGVVGAPDHAASSSLPRPPFAAVIIDSIQTMFTDATPAAAGSVTQVRECAVRLLQYAKLTGVPVLLVGHVTKAGDLAGPRVLEHLVDAGAL
jgi:DNA repair protein RadA/Sms